MVSSTQSGAFRDPVRFVQAFREVPFLYIADGHHRAASAARARAELKEQSFGHTATKSTTLSAVMFPVISCRYFLTTVWCTISRLSRRTFLAAVCKSFRRHRRRKRDAEQSRQVEHILEGMVSLTPHRFARPGTVAGST